LYIKPFKIIKCQGFYKRLIEKNQEAIEIGEREHIDIMVREIENDEWYSDIIYYLKNIILPDHLVDHKRRSLRLKDMKYCLTQYGLGWRNPDRVILMCVNKEEENKLVTDFDSGYWGGHFVAHTNSHKIPRKLYYWPTIFSNTHRYVRSCHPCQFFTRKQCLPSLPLKPVIVEEPFQKWGPDFIDEFNENSSNGYQWVSTATDYFTRWVEALQTNKAKEEVMIKFLKETFITIFGVPRKITMDNTEEFISRVLNEFCLKYGIILLHSNYYPQGNRLPESSNKNIMNIVKMIFGENKKSWDNKIKYSL
jgi:hypothetical protein